MTSLGLSNLTPWGPITSLLFELSSDDVQGIVELAGLTPDWTLTTKQAYFVEEIYLWIRNNMKSS